MITLNTEETLIDYIHNEVYENKTTYTILITAEGEHLRQMRKSTTALSLAFKLDPDFDMEKQMVIAKGEDVLSLMSSIEGRGKVLVIDEIQSAAGHREWFTSFNKGIATELELHGFRGLIVIVTAPQERLIDIDIRNMFNMVITIVYKSERGHFVKAKVEQKISKPKAQSDSYGVYVRQQYEYEGMNYSKKIDLFVITFAPRCIMKKYFAMSEPIKREVTDSNIQSLKAKRLKNERGQFNPNVFVSEIEKEPEKYIKVVGRKRYISRTRIMSDFNLSDIRARQVKELAEQKLGVGYANLPKGNQ